jgi:hypothetical protein
MTAPLSDYWKHTDDFSSPLALAIEFMKATRWLDAYRFPFLTTIHLGDLKRTMLTYSHT